MPLLRPSPSDYTTVVKALANAGAAVSNPQGSRPPSKGSVAFVNVSSVAALIRGSPRLASILPRVAAALPSLVPPLAPTPVAPVDPNYTVYQTSLFVNTPFWGGAFARDTSGNLYGRIVTQNFNLYKVAPNGTQTFLAGNGVIGSFIPGLGAAAQFDSSFGVNGFVIDSLGNLFTCSGSHRVIKIDPTGNVTSFAGTGTAGFNDGPTATATFSSPRAIAIDASNTLYVWEVDRKKAIRKITSSGQVSTLTYSAAFGPTFYGIAVDSTGVIYATDADSDRVYKITPTGPASADIGLLAGSTTGYTNGQGSAAQFNFDPSSGLCVDAFGNVYVGDTNNGSVRKISPSGNVITIAGNGTNAGSNSNTQLYSPTKPSIDATGVIYIGIGDVRKISPVISLANAGATDGFVIKYDSSGIPLWVRRIGGGLAESFSSFLIDSTGNVIVSGTYTSNPVTIYNADGTTEFATLTNSGSNDGFVVKYNSNGTPQWVRRIGGSGNDRFDHITSDSNDNIILSGTYTSNPLTIFNADGNPSFATFANVEPSTTPEILILKYNSAGTPLWARRIGGTDLNDFSTGIITDSSGNIVVAGRYESNPLTFFATDGTASSITLTHSGNGDGFVVKYNSEGTLLWARRIGGSGSDFIGIPKIDSTGNIIVNVGYQSNPVTIFQNDGITPLTTFANGTSGGSNILIVKYASNGDFVWARRLGSSGTNSEIAYSLNVDSNGNIIVTGSYTSAFTIFNADGTAFDTLTFIGGQDDGFIAKYSPSGTPQWVRKIAGSGADQPRVFLDSSGNIITRVGGGPSIIYDASQNPLTSLNRILIAKHDTNGTLLWHTYQVFTGAGFGFISAGSTDSNNNIIANASVTNGILTVYDSSGNAAATLTNTENQSEPFMIKYSPSGNILWTKKGVSGALNDSISSIIIDSTNNIVVTGTYASNPLTIT